MNLRDICFEIEPIAREAGSFIMSEAEGFENGTAERKGFNDFVTHVDRGAEKMLVEKLGKLIPAAGFLAATPDSVVDLRPAHSLWRCNPTPLTIVPARAPPTR